MKRNDKITLIDTLDDDGERDDDITSTSRVSKPSKASVSEPGRVSHSPAAAAPPSVS